MLKTGNRVSMGETDKPCGCTGFVTFAAFDQASVMWVIRCDEHKSGKRDETLWTDDLVKLN